MTFKLHKPIDFIFDYLTDMQKFVSVHPVIFKIDITGGNSYLVHETLKFVRIPFSFTYPVTVNNSDDKKVVTIKAIVMKITQITMNFALRSEGNSTIIDETIHFKTILPVKSIMQRIFKKQHEQLFRNIETLNE